MRRKGVRAHAEPATGTGQAHGVEAKLTVQGNGRAEARRSLKPGRPPGTNAVDDAGGNEQVRAIVAELRRNRRRVTVKNVAATSGAFTEDNLRYWLRTNRRRLRDY